MEPFILKDFRFIAFVLPPNKCFRALTVLDTKYDMFTISSKMPEIDGSSCSQSLQIRLNSAVTQKMFPRNVYAKRGYIWRSFKFYNGRMSLWQHTKKKIRIIGIFFLLWRGRYWRKYVYKSEYSETKVSNHVHSLLGKSKQTGQQIPYNLLIIYVCLSVVLKMRLIPHSAAYIGRYLCTFFPFYLILSSTSDHPSSIDGNFSSHWKDPSESTYNVAIITSKASFSDPPKYGTSVYLFSLNAFTSANLDCSS